MQITVYADLLFLTNFLTNLFLLMTTEKILQRRSNLWRRALAALLGALYAVCVYTKPLAFLGHPVLFGLFLTIVLLCAFPVYSGKHLLRCWLVFLCVHALFGGICYLLFFTTSLGIRFGAVLKNGVLYLHVPFYIPLATFPLGYALLLGLENIISYVNTRKSNLHILSFTTEEKNYTLSALLDTGNALYDSLTQLPVVIVQADAIDADTQNLRRIPYRTLTGEVRTLPAMYIQKIYIDGRETGGCMLALTDAKLSPDGRFCALLHSALFQGGYDEHSKNISLQTTHPTCR